jgi:MFS family permease
MIANIFRSFKGYNYRVWTAGAVVSNLGAWMQSIAQDWLVLTQLTHHDASAVGLVVALQYLPQLLLMPLTGSAADRLNQRNLIIVTQALLAMLALGLGLLTITGVVRLWHVYLFALALGCVTAFDTPARQVFVTKLVGEADLMNAVALNSALYNGARLIGPALAGALITVVGTGWAFIANGLSFVAVLVSLYFLRLPKFDYSAAPKREDTRFLDGLRYVWARPDLRTIIVVLIILGALGFNFTIFIASMAVSVFHADAREYGLLSSTMAIGTVAGALFTASRARPGFRALTISLGVFTVFGLIAALAPTFWTFAAALVVLGTSTLIITTETNSLMQLSTAPNMRGRVMTLRLGCLTGGLAIGSPSLGWIANTYGPRWALGIGAISGLIGMIVMAYAMAKRVPEAAVLSERQAVPLKADVHSE